MVGVVFQPRTLDLDLSVIQNLTYHAALHGIGKKEARARADDVLARVALSGRAQDKVRSLSGGQMRRLEIARALLVGEETFRQVNHLVEARELGRPRLKGIRQRQMLYEICGLRVSKTRPSFAAQLSYSIPPAAIWIRHPSRRANRS